MSLKIELYDTTMRDGAQGPGVKFSSDDQLRVVRELDAFGIAYIEGGQPGSVGAGIAFNARFDRASFRAVPESQLTDGTTCRSQNASRSLHSK